MIGWSNLNSWYYGVRYSKDCNPSELWNTYFTSSAYVAEFRQKNGEPDIREIRKTFLDKKKALAWEETVLRRMKAVKSTTWLNKGNAGKEFCPLDIVPWNKNQTRTDPGVAKMRQTKKGKLTGKENPNYGNRWSIDKKEEWSQRQSGSGNHFYNKKHSPETLEKMRIARTRYWEAKRN